MNNGQSWSTMQILISESLKLKQSKSTRRQRVSRVEGSIWQKIKQRKVGLI